MKKKGPDCAYCNGLGLSEPLLKLGWRVPVGESIAKDEKKVVPCDRCGKPVDNVLRKK